MSPSPTADPSRAVAGAPIDVSAVLTHRPGPLIVFGSGTGVVYFSATREEDGLSSGPPLRTSDCGRHELASETVVPYGHAGPTEGSRHQLLERIGSAPTVNTWLDAGEVWVGALAAASAAFGGEVVSSADGQAWVVADGPVAIQLRQISAADGQEAWQAADFLQPVSCDLMQSDAEDSGTGD